MSICFGIVESPATLSVESITKLPPEVEHTAYRIAREALTNVVRHAGADQATVTLSADGNQVVMAVVDNGRGFDPAKEASTDRHGVRGMHERAHLIEAQLDIRRSEGGGTAVELTMDKTE